jgi:DNA-binding NarL/FixJ family response regulator
MWPAGAREPFAFFSLRGRPDVPAQASAIVADRRHVEPDRAQLEGYEEVVAALAEPPKPSARELELLRLMADGLTDAEIAEKLSISVKTMRSRLHALRLKMQARTRTHLVAIAFRRGLLEIDRRNMAAAERDA